MTPLKIAASIALAPVLRLRTTRQIVTLDNTDFTDIAAVVLSLADARSGMLTLLRHTGFSLPVFIQLAAGELPENLPEVTAILRGDEGDGALLEEASAAYEAALLPPFFDTLTKYVAMENSTFACPGHQGGAFFKKHPAGRQFFRVLWRNAVSCRYVQCRREARRSADS